MKSVMLFPSHIEIGINISIVKNEAQTPTKIPETMNGPWIYLDPAPTSLITLISSLDM